MADDRRVIDLTQRLNEDRIALGQTRDELTDTLATLKRIPLELTLPELEGVVAELEHITLATGATGSGIDKLRLALRIEQGR